MHRLLYGHCGESTFFFFLTLQYINYHYCNSKWSCRIISKVLVQKDLRKSCKAGFHQAGLAVLGARGSCAGKGYEDKFLTKNCLTQLPAKMKLQIKKLSSSETCVGSGPLTPGVPQRFPSHHSVPPAPDGRCRTGSASPWTAAEIPAGCGAAAETPGRGGGAQRPCPAPLSRPRLLAGSPGKPSAGGGRRCCAPSPQRRLRPEAAGPARPRAPCPAAGEQGG